MVRPEGLEPPTQGLGILRSIHLSYGRIVWKFFGEYPGPFKSVAPVHSYHFTDLGLSKTVVPAILLAVAETGLAALE